MSRSFERGSLWAGVGPAAVAIVTVASCLGAPSCSTPLSDRPATEPGEMLADASRATALFERHCALCHGQDGSGLGPAGPLLDPPPRSFGSGRFCLASTVNGVPSDADLVRTLRRGMPGSAMPSFGFLSDADLDLLAAHVRQLAIDGMARQLVSAAGFRGEVLEEDEARALARTRLTPGAPIEVPHAGPVDQATLALGAGLYLEHCAACHGKDGKGRKPVVAWRETHDVRLARDFTAGVMKGGASERELTWRILAGMPGAGMPPTAFDDPALVRALVAHVETLLPPGADTRLVQQHETIHARRIDGSVPEDARDLLWSRAAEVRLALAPLSWHDDAILHADVAFLHDGRSLAARVRWSDPTRDDRVLGASQHSDGVAIEFSADAEPRMFGMGSRRDPVNIWHWKAFRFRDVAGMLDLLENPPHVFGREAQSDVPLYVPAPGWTQPSAEADSVEARGFETFKDHRTEVLAVTARPVRKDGIWQVVFTRSLAARAEHEIDLRGGAAVQVAFAIWNGSAGDRAGRKSITIWHALELDP